MWLSKTNKQKNPKNFKNSLKIDPEFEPRMNQSLENQVVYLSLGL